MTALTITESQVLYVSGNKLGDQVAGEAFTTGQSVYKNTDGKWLKAQCDGTALEAGSEGIGLALARSAADGARFTVALPGAIVTLGAGAAPAAGLIYVPGTTAGSLIPTADLASTNKVTPLALGIGTNQVLILGEYNAGAVIA